MKGFKLFGVVKETGIDDVGLTEFHNQHFPFEIYKDEALVFYNDFFGKRKLGLTTYNPLKLYSGYKQMTERLSEKKLEGNYVGEGIVQGGVIIFGKDGVAKFAYEEETGKELVMEDIVAALKKVSEMQATGADE
eukprot:156418_1